MRSQASKPLPKKGDVNKTAFKISALKQTGKKKISPKKGKNLVGKSRAKSPKKNSKDDIATKNNEGSTTGHKSEHSDASKAGPSNTRSDSPVKKSKKESKEKKDAIKNSLNTNIKKIVSKKCIMLNKKEKIIKSNKGKKIDVKYKNKINVASKSTSKFSKAKTIIKKGNTSIQKSKSNVQTKDESSEKNQVGSDCNKDKESCVSKECSQKNQEGKTETLNVKILSVTENEEVKVKDIESKSKFDSNLPNLNNSPKIAVTNQPETPKHETERPPKFFTSIRSPRTVDIDVKCLKNSKGNLNVSDRFLSMKFEPKSDDSNKDKNVSNTLVSQGPEIDVYTFTEKVDSPKNILSDFRSPINKNVGRVRPIARVKGTIIDKKTESEKKKYSPHRPIEEVVKQLKANKRSEELINNQTQDNNLNISQIRSDSMDDEKDTEDKPKQIVSKSYKMVARKSSITGKPFSPIKFLDTEPLPNKNDKSIKSIAITKKTAIKSKKHLKKDSSSDDEFDTSKFSLNTKTRYYSSSEESVSESNDEHDSRETSGSDAPRNKTKKNKKYKRITDGVKKTTSKELKELSKDSLIDLKDESMLLGEEKPSKRRLKLLSMWAGPKKHRMASLNALAKVHCLYENESRTHMELGLMKTIDRQIMPSTSKLPVSKKKEPKSKEIEKHESTSESEYETNNEKKEDTSDSSDDSPPQRCLRGEPGIRSAGKYWDPKSSTSSSEDSELETKKKPSPEKKKIIKSTSAKSDSDKPPAKMKKTAGVPVKKKRNRNEVVMDLKDMVVQKRMASLNATAILAASYEKRSPKSNKDETTSDSCSDESFSQKPKNGASSGVKSELKIEETKLENDDSSTTDKKQNVEFVVNQDTDVTITGVYSTHHREGFCTVSGMQYRISSTSHTQTTATANCEKEGCTRDDGARYTPLTALSSMQPPAEHSHPHQHPVPELGGLSRRPGCSSAFSAPSPAAHHEPGYYQPAGPLIKESSAEAERALTRYHPQPHYHPPHPSMLQQYGPPYYPELCYGRYYRSPGPYHIPPPQPDGQMVGVGSEPYPPPQYYGSPPCYQHSPQRIPPYVEYRCPCPLNACPKNVLIGPATGKGPTGSGPVVDVLTTHTPPGAAFRHKVRASVLDAASDTHGSGKDPPLGPEPPVVTDAPHPRTLPAIGGASPKRQIYDVRDSLCILQPADTLGPPSPARGSAGACHPQPPSSAPRRARLGKAMARRTLVGDDTILITAPQPLVTHHSDIDDDVLAISPPACVPIDLSSSDERSTPLVDVKKENEGPPIFTAIRKPDAQALREHNNCTTLTDIISTTDPAKSAKRRYSKPKLEIEMRDSQLEDGCKTNGIGEHVKLQKRRKVSGDQTDLARTETITRESKKRVPQAKKVPKLIITEKKTAKRKLERSTSGSKPKKMLLETNSDDDIRNKTIISLPEEQFPTKSKTKSALLLDNLMRKNSVDRPEKGYASDTELNPADLFLSPNENIIQNCTKKVFNINNNIVENTTVNTVRPNTIAAVTQLIEKKLAFKNSCKLEKVDSKVTNAIKSVLKTAAVKPDLKDIKEIKNERKVHSKCDLNLINKTNGIVEKDIKPLELSETNEIVQIIMVDRPIDDYKSGDDFEANIPKSTLVIETGDKATKTNELSEAEKKDTESTRHDRPLNKRHKHPNGELKGKAVEKVVKLLVSKRPAIKTDEATLLVEEACASPTPTGGVVRGRARRRGAGSGMGGSRRGRRPRSPPTLLDLEPRAAPRWSNGWQWDGDHYLSKVYLNNDSRLDRTARCWSRMSHASGDSVGRGDCVLLRASVARAQPFVARVASLWENPDDGEMMVSLVWYYRPEHTERGRQPADALDEVFASRHKDANSVACIEDKCYVLTFNEYCRYRKRLKAMEEGITITPSIVPPLPQSEMNPAFTPNDSKLPPSVSPELVLFCRKIYDFRSKKIHVPNK